MSCGSLNTVFILSEPLQGHKDKKLPRLYSLMTWVVLCGVMVDSFTYCTSSSSFHCLKFLPEALCGDFVACCRACRSEEEVLGFFFFVLGFTLLASQGSMVSSTNRDVPEQERDRERYNICNYDIYNFNRNIFTR